MFEEIIHTVAVIVRSELQYMVVHFRLHIHIYAKSSFQTGAAVKAKTNQCRDQVWAAWCMLQHLQPIVQQVIM